MTFDEWESTHPPMQTESPNAYARRAFNAGVRSRHRIESVGDTQAECAPRYAVRLFKDALIDRFDQYPIPSQLGVTAIMRVIKQFHDGYTAPQAECAPREAQPVEWLIDRPAEPGFYWLWRINYKGERMPPEVIQLHQGNFLFPGDAKPFSPNSTIFAGARWLPAAPTPERADAKKDAALTNEKIEAAIEAWFDTDGKDVDDHQSRMRAAILAANKEPERAQESAAVQDAIEDVAKYFEDCGDPYGAKMIRKYAFNKFAVAKEPQP